MIKIITPTEPFTSGPFSLRRHDAGYPAAIVGEKGYDVVHLEPSERTVETAEYLVQLLNAGWEASRSPAPNREAVTLDAVEDVLLGMSEDERVELFGRFCRGCGTADLPCCCENDE